MTNPFDQFLENTMTQDEEAGLGVRCAKGSENACNELTMANMREALLYAKRCCRAEIDDHTLISLCYQALMRNAKRFQPSKQRFFPFCKVGIRGQLCRYWESLKPVRNAESGPLVGEFSEPEEDTERQFVPIRRAMPDADIPPFPEPSRLEGVLNLLNRGNPGLLTQQERMIVLLRYQSGLTFPEIARLLDISKSAAHATHKLAIEKLRSLKSEFRGLLNE